MIYSQKINMLTLGADQHSQLLNHVEEAIRNWEQGKATDTIYLDFAKAFDKVDHDILCHKLRALGITGKLGVWIRVSHWKIPTSICKWSTI